MYITKSKISYPVTLTGDEFQIRRALSLDILETDDNDYIESLIQSATELTEGEINQDIAYTNNIVSVDSFNGDEIVINQGNLNTITSIVNNDSSTLISNFTYTKDYYSFTIKFSFAYSDTAITLNFTTGYNDKEDVPKGLKQAIIIKTADLYDTERSSYIFSSVKYNNTWETLCKQYKLL